MLELDVCETCEGSGEISWDYGLGDVGSGPCGDCKGEGYVGLTPCCGVDLIDEAQEVDDAYERRREEGWDRL